jgi:hypothetical protein
MVWLIIAAQGVFLLLFRVVFQHEKGRSYRLVQYGLVFFVVVLCALAGVDLFGDK